ncbi:16S rRNA (cytidine(1402)-2'-O)-methyltransferase [Pelagibacteraceae bacterium]|nr:16S rRNA (cytidine(1402)-2'-O)-methyltransferase [Pelagibacteraceae bacterium]
MENGIYIVATPIGNLDDITLRAIDTLKTCDFIICENPKHSLKLLNKLGIKKKLISLHDYNENSVIQRLSDELFVKKIVLISDAGSPLISDPGYKLINFCIKSNIRVISIPGPSSIIPALQISGMPINEFYFAGFLPKTKNDIIKFFKKIKEINKTSVFFVSSHKVSTCLNFLEAEMGDRTVSISKEITKINEKTFRGLVSKIKDEISDKPKNLKGEFVIVVQEKSIKNSQNLSLEKYKLEINRLLQKFSLTDVVEIVHKLTGITKNKVYKWVLKLKKS